MTGPIPRIGSGEGASDSGREDSGKSSRRPFGRLIDRLKGRFLANFEYNLVVRRIARDMVSRLGRTVALEEVSNVRQVSQIPEVEIFAANLEREIGDAVPATEFFQVDSLEPRTIRSALSWRSETSARAPSQAGGEDVQIILKRFRQAQLSPDSPLTDRQMECLEWAAHGKSSADIAIILGVGKRTVDDHLAATCEKLGVKNRVQAVAKLERIRGLGESP